MRTRRRREYITAFVNKITSFFPEDERAAKREELSAHFTKLATRNEDILKKLLGYADDGKKHDFAVSSWAITGLEPQLIDLLESYILPIDPSAHLGHGCQYSNPSCYC